MYLGTKYGACLISTTALQWRHKEHHCNEGFPLQLGIPPRRNEVLSEIRNEPKQVKFRVSEDEFERLTLIADSVGMSVPAFVKAKAQGTRMRQPKIDRRGAIEVAKELRAIGTNLNQVAKWCNSRDEVDSVQLDRLNHNIEMIKKELEKAWQQLS